MGVAEVRVEGGRREEGNVRRGRALKGSGIGDEEGRGRAREREIRSRYGEIRMEKGRK